MRSILVASVVEGNSGRGARWRGHRRGCQNRRGSILLPRVCIVAVTLFVLLPLALVLPTRVTAAMLGCCVVGVVVWARWFSFSVVSCHANSPTYVRGTIINELTQVILQRAALVHEVVPTRFESVCVFKAGFGGDLGFQLVRLRVRSTSSERSRSIGGGPGNGWTWTPRERWHSGVRLEASSWRRC